MNNFQYDPTGNGSGNFGNHFGGGHDFAKEQSFVSRVFNWMFFGLLATAVVAFIVASNPFIVQMLYSNSMIMIVLAIGLFALVWNLSANINKMSPQAAAINFFAYSALNGVLLSSVLLIYTASSVFTTFLTAAATFGAMALYGMTTKKDLTNIGSLCGMALLGLIIAQFGNMFFHSSGLSSVINYAGVLIFVGLTAYDVQKIKQIGNSMSYNPNYAIIGALRLYLDFINLFLFLLRILGSRRD